jgi:sugar transferase (PEP-CTERM/EpsH1 system associated)
MNLLYLCHRIPYPPDKGDKIRSFHQVRSLSEQHAVHLLTFVDDPEDWKHLGTLRGSCRSVDAVFRSRVGAQVRAGLALLSGESLSVASFRSEALQGKVDATLAKERIDLVLIFSSAMAQYVPSSLNIPVLLDLVDVDSEKWRMYGDHLPPPKSWLYRLEADRLLRFETRAANAADHCIVISRAEAELLEGKLRRPISVLTNGVDLEYYRRPEGSRQESGAPDIVFVGAMDYFPNEDAVLYFCRDIFPAVRDAIPDATFTIVGRSPTARVRSLAGRPGVRVTGSVSDVRPYLLEARVSVAPFRIARGLQNKVLEAMAMDLPVVGTTLAFQGIAATQEDGARIVDRPEDMARDLVTLLREPMTARQRAGRGRAFVERHHRWEQHAIALDSLVRKLGEGRSKRS